MYNSVVAYKALNDYQRDTLDPSGQQSFATKRVKLVLKTLIYSFINYNLFKKI